MGPGGPPSFRIKLYRGSEFLGQDVYLDSCVAHSQVSNDLFLLIDTCQKTFTEIRPDKKPIEAVDSIQIFSTSLQQTKTLSHEQSKIFVEDWNKSTPSDYREEPVDSVFFPNYDYKLTVFTQSGKREFLADYYLISERTHWVYYITGKESPDYFNKLWRQ